MFLGNFLNKATSNIFFFWFFLFWSLDIVVCLFVKAVVPIGLIGRKLSEVREEASGKSWPVWENKAVSMDQQRCTWTIQSPHTQPEEQDMAERNLSQSKLRTRVSLILINPLKVSENVSKNRHETNQGQVILYRMYQFLFLPSLLDTVLWKVHCVRRKCTRIKMC